MDKIQIKSLILDILKQDDRLRDEEKVELNQILLLDLVDHIDEKIIWLLIESETLRKKFFLKIKDIYVFKTNHFRFFMEENKIENSYTAYKNRIWLTDGKKFLKDTNDVVLHRPYKDCVLEWWQSTEEWTDSYFEYSEKTEEYEEKTAKRKEVFYNNVLAHDEIDRLFDEKALVNWKRFNKDWEHKVKNLKRDEDGVIRENLIIKGNNLLALHSLKKQFAGKVKLIYIDPPYNTGNDWFKYNDNFNHSTWLTFMKNRLEIAKDLLKDDWVIFVQCDDNEQAYLKVLMDDVFKWNFLNTISVKAKVSAWASWWWEDKRIKKNIEYIHCYYNKTFVIFNDAYKETEIQSYINLMKNEGKSFKYTQVLVSTWEKKYFKTIKDWSGQDIVIYHHKNVITKTINQIKKEEWIKTKEIYNKYFDQIFTTTNAQSSIRKRVRDAVWENKEFYSIEYTPKSWRHKGILTTQYYTWNKMVLLIWFSNTATKDAKWNVIKKEKYWTFWDGIDYNNLNKEWSTIFASGKKPEQLLHRIIEMSTAENDIILDYHLWSWTTCAVAHKMSRQYIWIEQLDYGQNDSTIRLKNVINWDQSWISKIVNRENWWDFIYFQLSKWNEQAKEKILACKSISELSKFFDKMYEKYFLKYNIKIKEFKKNVLQEEQFKNLSLDDQKKIFIAMLDNNQMYVNKTEMEDKKFGISKNDIKLTEEFYKK